MERLKDSMRSTGAWPTIIARPHPEKEAEGYVQLAFGHHRMEAIRQLVASKELASPEVELIVRPIADDEMLKMMADENAEEFGTNFALGTMNAISAVVKAYAAGVIKLPAIPPNARTKFIRYAPSYARSGENEPTTTNSFPYTAESIAEYLGWRYVAKDSEVVAQERVYTALNALELIELGVCKPTAFQGLGQAQALAVVKHAQVVYQNKLRELAGEREEKAAKEEAKKQAASAVVKVVGALKEGAGVREIKAESKKLRAEAVPTQKKASAKEVDISRAMEKFSGEVKKLQEDVELVTARGKPLFAAFGGGAICDEKISRGVEDQLLELKSYVNELKNLFFDSLARR